LHLPLLADSAIGCFISVGAAIEGRPTALQIVAKSAMRREDELPAKSMLNPQKENSTTLIGIRNTALKRPYKKS